MKALTKQDLIELGVTNVTEDGKVYVNGKLKRQTIIVGRHKYGEDKKYLAIGFTDRSTKIPVVQRLKRTNKKNGDYVYTNENGWRYPIRTITVSRVVLAWYEGKVDKNMDVDHIDNNPFNNHISNLQAISRKANLAKRLMTQEEISKMWVKVRNSIEGY